MLRSKDHKLNSSLEDIDLKLLPSDVTSLNLKLPSLFPERNLPAATPLSLTSFPNDSSLFRSGFVF